MTTTVAGFNGFGVLVQGANRNCYSHFKTLHEAVQFVLDWISGKEAYGHKTTRKGFKFSKVWKIVDGYTQSGYIATIDYDGNIHYV